MKIKSLKLFLIISIGLSITIIDGVTIWWSYYSINNNTAKFFDVLLIESAEKIKIFLGGDLSKRHIDHIQGELNNCSRTKKCIMDPSINLEQGYFSNSSKWLKGFSKRYRTESVFQIWKIDPEELILYSKHAPDEDFAEFEPGFQTVRYNDKNWRVYTQVKPKLNIAIQTAQQEDLRDDLAEMIIQEHIYPVMILTPILLFLIFIAVKLTSNSILYVSQAIKRRDPKNLNLLKISNVPNEILPLIEELNRLFNMINHSFDREQRFNSDAAHELKTPLAAIKSQSQVALSLLNQNNKENTDYNYKIKHNLNNIIKGVDRSSHLVQQLLILSRLSPTKPLDHIERCMLDQISREVIANCINSAIDQKIEVSQSIKYNTKDKKIPAIKGNKILLSTLCRNLIDNAIRYSGANSTVTINIIINLETISLVVMDSGAGLPDDLKDRIFDRFYRQPGTKTEGSGLGLSIVKLISELHNAEIKLSDNHITRHGLCIEVIFPR